MILCGSHDINIILSMILVLDIARIRITLNKQQKLSKEEKT